MADRVSLDLSDISALHFRCSECGGITEQPIGRCKVAAKCPFCGEAIVDEDGEESSEAVAQAYQDIVDALNHVANLMRHPIIDLVILNR